MYKACIFDLDGTLTDTLDSLAHSVNLAMKELGIPGITREECRQFVGNGSAVLIEKTLKKAGEEYLSRFEEALAVYLRVFDENCTWHVKPYDGIPDLIQEMKQEGMKLGVLSNKPDRQAVHVVETVFGKGTFDLIRGQRDDFPRKPDPSASLLIAEAFQAEPSEVLYIGDSEVDAATGKAAGMDTVLVTWGFRSREVLEEAGPSWIADSTKEIVEIMKNRRKRDEQLQRRMP